MYNMISARKRTARASATLIRDAAHAAPDSTDRMEVANAHLEHYLREIFGAALSRKVLAGYIAMRSEADPLPVMAAHPGQVCVPVVAGPGKALVFHRWHTRAEMRTGTFGVQIPAEADALEPQLLIVPGLAFDLQGYRLGYGGGFYDRTLAQLRARGRVTAIGFAFSDQRVNAVPRCATDETLDALVTDAGVQVFAD